jgi:RNA polymerase sigma-70 factor (ECF subfamily)
MSDAELVMLAQKHDTVAFEILVRRHQRPVYNLVFQLAPDWNTTADLTQEVFIRAWRSIEHLRQPKSFRSWLNQIATNLFYDELRKRPRLSIVSMDEPIEPVDGDETPTRDIPDLSALPDECVQRQELAELIQKAITQLPEQFRTAIILRELQGMSYEEIAALTGSEMGTVKSRIARARGKIQRILAPYMMAA